MLRSCRSSKSQHSNAASRMEIEKSTIITANNLPATGVCMELDFVQQRQQAHLLIDVLPKEKLFAVHNLLEVLVEPLSRSLAMAPVEEEELIPETKAALNRSSAQLDRGESVSHEEILREFVR
jgi:hypothetical protein